jgi:hypothetical protein
MKVTLYKMTPQGIIATSFMLLQLMIIMLPSHAFSSEPFLYLIIKIMSLPANFVLVWTCLFSGEGPCTLDLITEPLKIIMNAYFWGYFLVWIYHKEKVRSMIGKTPPNHAS